MFTTKAPRIWFAALAGVLAIAAAPIAWGADEDAALKEQIRILKQRIDELNQQVNDLAKRQQQQEAAAAAAKAAPPAAKPEAGKAAETEPKFAAFSKGFYGTLDASVDYTTKGMNGFVAYPFTSLGVNGGPPYVAGPAKNGGAPPFGRVS